METIQRAMPRVQRDDAQKDQQDGPEHVSSVVDRVMRDLRLKMVPCEDLEKAA